jgi:hypothetical protein
MAKESKSAEYVIHGTLDPEEWTKFFKKHFVPSPKGSRGAPEEEDRAKATSSCEDYGCPHTHNGLPLAGCIVEISGRGRVTGVRCQYQAVAKQ